MAGVHRFTRPAMGTVASVHVHDDVPAIEARAAVLDAFAELERLEEMFSTFRPTSEISRVNRGERSLLECSDEVLEVLDACTWLEHESDGAFCARRPEPPYALDPAGYVKGWAAARAAACLTGAGLTRWYFSVGGDLCTSGTPVDAPHWSIALADPSDASRAVAVIDLPAGTAVATSGIGARGRHLWHGRTGERPAPFASLTVIGPSLAWADAFATAAFARGDDALAWISRFDGYLAVAVGHDGTITHSAEMPVVA